MGADSNIHRYNFLDIIYEKDYSKICTIIFNKTRQEKTDT
jgi:hypothetical protein